MKNKLITTIIILFIFISFFAIDINQKYNNLKMEFETFKKDKLYTFTLKPKESVNILLGKKQYTLKVIDIIKDPPCATDFDIENTIENCKRIGEYAINIAINGIVFALDSNLNNSAQIITANFRTNYVIYYIPEYNGKEATFFVEEDKNWEKEKNLIIGNYLVYVDENNKVIDLKNFAKETQTWKENYIGIDLEEIRKKLIEN